MHARMGSLASTLHACARPPSAASARSEASTGDAVPSPQCLPQLAAAAHARPWNRRWPGLTCMGARMVLRMLRAPPAEPFPVKLPLLPRTGDPGPLAAASIALRARTLALPVSDLRADGRGERERRWAAWPGRRRHTCCTHMQYLHLQSADRCVAAKGAPWMHGWAAWCACGLCGPKQWQSLRREGGGGGGGARTCGQRVQATLD